MDVSQGHFLLWKTAKKQLSRKQRSSPGPLELLLLSDLSGKPALMSCKHQILSQQVSKPEKPVGVLWVVHGEFISQGETGTS